ncbi:flagellar protein FlaG [Salinispira pacifica]|uniref:Flagellar protein FlaG n=1 Tax=Salinispira pacifica TaxID=1307761 RepID=V5WG95_9SPIO|nr:flagellar protein FlaG [Salinispira pacifica]AHC14640.1 hypothetical protein L21SP2_1239 [Salinispira pacifica]
MSFEIHGVVGQGSSRPATNQDTRRDPSSPVNSPTAGSEQRDYSIPGSSRNDQQQKTRQLQAEARQQQQIDARRRSEEAEAVQQASQEEVEREVQQALKELEQVNLSFAHKLKYSIDHEDHEILVKVIDPETDEVIKELPPVALQRLHDRIQEFIGLLVDEEA